MDKAIDPAKAFELIMAEALTTVSDHGPVHGAWLADLAASVRAALEAKADQEYDKACAAVQGAANGIKVGRANAEREAKAEPICKIVFNGCQYGIQDIDGNAFDMSKYPNVALYAAPPSPAEVKAQALEEWESIRRRASDIEDQVCGGLASPEQVYEQMWQLVEQAKRLREEV